MSETNLERAAIDPMPIHQWTHDGDRVLLVRCSDEQGRGYGGFVWPASGKVFCPKAQAHRAAASNVTGEDRIDCASGGLFGWAWALNIGGGKEPDYGGVWQVFAAAPADVIDLGDKQKVVGEAEVIYSGDALGAMIRTLAGRHAWTMQRSDRVNGSAANSGVNGSAANSGVNGSAANSGYRGIASTTGEDSILNVSGTGALGAVTAKCWRWRLRKGALIAWRWEDACGILRADDCAMPNGTVVNVIAGVVQIPASAGGAES